MESAWNPRSTLRRGIDRAFQNAGSSDDSTFHTAFLPGQAARRFPLINLAEDSDHIYVEALAPGVDPESITMAVMRNMLTISGERQRHPEDIKLEAFHRSERAAGKFVRTIELPAEIDVNQVQAEYKHGILMATLPIAESAKPKKINVHTA